MTAAAITPGRRPGRLVRRMLHGGGFWPALPAVLFLIVFLVLPMLTLLAFGFVTIDRGRIVGDSFTLQPLWAALNDTLVWRLTWRSFYVAVISTVMTLLLAYPVAYLYSQTKGIWRTLILVAVISPLLTSALVRAYAWLVILGGRRGIVNHTLIQLGVIDEPLRILNTDYAVIIGMTQIHLPFMILPLLAVLAERDRRLEEASFNLGASRAETFFKVVVPMSVPAIFAGLALVFAISYTNFIVPQLLGGGNYATLAVQVYEQTVVVLDWTRGAVLAAILLSSSFAFVFLIVWVGSRINRWSEARA
ncbi:ABC transporter permease [Prosthecomicrobium hirschii]|uniref:ABC transporter permease n=1 Tax=Prosthecodimorpha hirschii TaxID=665126 RepID=UPI00221F6190|nr:ABC transporter permease [Prosthecomicrobium hirschii]MCW1839902.1 ABC transporter permease [Prosthecomicrobium hirschii]